MDKRYVFTGIVFVLWIVGFYLAADFSTKDVNLVDALMEINPLSIIAAVGLYLLAICIGIFILYRALRSVGVKPPVKGLAKAWIFGSFLDNIAPTITPIGEASMAYFLDRFYRLSYTKSLAAIGMYVSSWGISVSIFSTISVIMAISGGAIPGQFVIPVIFVVIMFSFITVGWLLLLTKKGLIERIICKFTRSYNKFYGKIRRKKITFEECVVKVEFERSYASLQSVMSNKRSIVSSVLLFFIPQLAHVACIYVLVLGFGVQISFFEVLGIQIVASVMGLISFIPSGMGVYEIIATAALSAGVPAFVAISAIFIYRLIFVWMTNLIGGLIGIVEGIENPGKVATK
jgi:uncharacterized protein (TIRG00374 family)